MTETNVQLKAKRGAPKINARRLRPGPARFEVFGPFELPTNKAGLVDRRSLAAAAFWRAVEGREAGLSYAYGCFVLTERTAMGALRPWYVGISQASSFRKLFHAANVVETANAIIQCAKTSAVDVSLVGRLTKSGSFATAPEVTRQELEILQAYLSALCFAKNSAARSAKQGSGLADLVIPGLLNGKKFPVTIDARVLKSALGL